MEIQLITASPLRRRDCVLSWGMEGGLNQSYEALDRLLVEMG